MQQGEVPIKYETISIQNDANKKYFPRDFIQMAAKPTIADLIVSVLRTVNVRPL